ncbi:MAG: hypothetical protein UU36_C0039G0002 [Candidatus Uhrbacteria bacterium GW2011_GWE2_41_1153]|nr:MAG: hypothetical protein UU36_C0039G0002 [Candidatus Uhrbacteria bacterium GW2011_GWE2_41_1153]
MESNGNQKKTVVIFPGAWSRGTAELWLAFVIKFFERLIPRFTRRRARSGVFHGWDSLAPACAGQPSPVLKRNPAGKHDP